VFCWIRFYLNFGTRLRQEELLPVAVEAAAVVLEAVAAVVPEVVVEATTKRTNHPTPTRVLITTPMGTFALLICSINIVGSATVISTIFWFID